ncbi:hypothetical protein ALP97_200040 [Pseudomonas salomonii]|uniref:Uncharacterized protein n=1 Tax=Pseudomonas salomonii TaxID=191391 RepID=A0A3M4QDA3_9PSED|nr:hypothetical protein ALP97_200040 [Pseudomonas salomonii]
MPRLVLPNSVSGTVPLAMVMIPLLHVQGIICECTKVADHFGDGF